MKLLLASDGEFLINQGYALLGIPRTLMHIGYVTTASKGARSTEYVQRHKKAMEQHGYRYAEIDIENKSEQMVEHFFRDKNVIHIEGGNTFYLLQAVKRTGFDKIIKSYVTQGKIYVGTSAGSSIAGPTIGLSSHIPKDASVEQITALNLVPFQVVSHFTPEKTNAVRQQIKTTHYTVKILRDGQGILVEDGRYRLVGEGEEVKL